MADENKDLEIKTTVKRTTSEKSAEYASDVANIEANMAAKKQEVKAAKEKKEAQKAQEEKKKAQEEAEKVKQAQLDEAQLKEMAGQMFNLAKNSKHKGFISGVIVGLVLGVLLTFMVAPALGLFDKNNINQGQHDNVISDNLIGYTAVDFRNAILTSSKVKEDLEVLQQDVIVPTTITKAGFGNLAIFSKVKECEFAGSGVYTINMGNIDYDHIDYDEKNGVVTVYIPHANLEYVIMNEAHTTFHDTEKGLLAFGDLKLSAEEYNQVTVSVKQVMSLELGKKDLLDLADDYGQKKVWQILNPLIETVSKEVELVVAFED